MEDIDDICVMIAKQTGWSRDYLLDLPVGELRQVRESVERVARMFQNG